MSRHEHGWCGRFPVAPIELFQATIDQQFAGEDDLDRALARSHAVEFAPPEAALASELMAEPAAVSPVEESPEAYRERYLAEAQAFWEVRKQLWAAGTAEQSVAMVRKQTARRLLKSKRASLKPILDLYSILGGA